jgi:hypothetical protein
MREMGVRIVHVEIDIEIRRAILDDLPRLTTWNGATERVVRPELGRQEAGEAVVLLAMLKSFPCGHLLCDLGTRAHEGIAKIWHVAVWEPLQGGRHRHPAHAGGGGRDRRAGVALVAAWGREG